MKSKACFENFYEKIFGILIWDIVIRNEKWKTEALKSFKFENVY